MAIVSLFDMSGHAVRPWAQAGFKCFCFDIVNTGKLETFDSGGSIEYVCWDATWLSAKQEITAKAVPSMIFSFPPCTDLAVSGAKHFAAKFAKNPNYRKEAINLVLIAPEIADLFGCPWLVENPIGVLSTEWRAPDKIVHPYEFGGYLPENDIHPTWPRYIEARDAYEKRTCFWYGNGFKFPKKKQVKPKTFGRGFNKQTALLGGKSERTKQIRSMTPRGIFIGIFEANNG